MQRVVFIDRDGVINKYPGDFKYVVSLREFRFLPKAKQAIASLYKAGYRIFVISNQAGVTKGIYAQSTLDRITDEMLRGINRSGGHIEKVFYCIHTEEQNCNCRKPKIGLIQEATGNLNKFDVKNSFFIGDSIRDIKTGKAAGCKTVLVLSGKEKIKNKQNWEVQPDFIADNLLKAAEIIINK